MLKGFKEFVLRGNVIDLAVAVVIGAAFTAVVNSLVENIFNPLLGALFKSDSLATAFVVEIPTLTGEPAKVAFGAFIGALIQFVLVAAVVYFVIVVPMNHFKRVTTKPTVADEPAAPSELSLLTEIRDLLKTGESSPLPPARDDTTDGR
ncbi:MULTISPECIES: large conductance mechanosensitive channel protein MscL [unclassified Plantibacter]|uniref:large conductance mechanosensitive channel protein MscL n=1 Tax=unclassified Plantibacter TaxID=2624265 RepID=UPI003D34A76E